MILNVLALTFQLYFKISRKYGQSTSSAYPLRAHNVVQRLWRAKAIYIKLSSYWPFPGQLEIFFVLNTIFFAPTTRILYAVYMLQLMHKYTKIPYITVFV